MYGVPGSNSYGFITRLDLLRLEVLYVISLLINAMLMTNSRFGERSVAFCLRRWSDHVCGVKKYKVTDDFRGTREIMLFVTRYG
jgi:hypothetical protein